MKKGMGMKNFHFKIKEEYTQLRDGQCCEEVWEGWHTHRCKRKVAEIIDEVGLCKIHAKGLRKWRKLNEPMENEK